MGRIRADPFRFHLDRDAAFVQHAITRKRLLAGLGQAGACQLHFFIAEERVTALQPRLSGDHVLYWHGDIF